MRALRPLALLAILALGALAAGCNIIAAPGRCVGCCYDNCIVPYASRAAPRQLKTARHTAPGAGAEAMAY